MRRALFALLGAVLAGGAALTVTVSAFHHQQHSTFYRTVESDPSWLAYLPRSSDGLEPVLAGLNYETAPGHDMRRVDFMDGRHDGVVSLCFAATRRAVLISCPGSTFLGRSTRPGMDLPAMSQIGTHPSHGDWVALLSTATPRFEDVPYLDD